MVHSKIHTGLIDVIPFLCWMICLIDYMVENIEKEREIYSSYIKLIQFVIAETTWRFEINSFMCSFVGSFKTSSFHNLLCLFYIIILLETRKLQSCVSISIAEWKISFGIWLIEFDRKKSCDLICFNFKYVYIKKRPWQGSQVEKSH